MYEAMGSLTLVLLWGILGAIMAFNFWNWGFHYVNGTEQDNKNSSGGWLHQKAYEYLEIDSGNYPMPAFIFYLLAVLISILASFVWFITLPLGVILIVLTYFKYKKRKEKEDESK